MVSLASPLRVLMTADPLGGVWTFSLDLMEALRGSAVQFALATMGRELSPSQREAVVKLDHVRLYESSFKVEWMDDPWDEVNQAGDWLLAIAAEFKPDLIHLNGYAHAALEWNRPVLVAGHSCVYSWFSAVKKLPPPRDPWSLYHQYVRLGLDAATVVTAPSEAMLKALSIHYGLTGKPEKTIYNGRPPHLFKPGPKAEFVLTGGRLWDEAKNIRVLDRAAEKLSWPIRAAGEQERPGGGTAPLFGLHLIGNLSPEQFAVELSRAPIFALPARYEPFGLSALEAAFSGCALVLGDIPSLREIWGDAALFVPPDDANAWRDNLQQLISDAGLRRSMAQRAGERALNFTARRMAGGYLNAYQSLSPNKGIKHEDRSVLPIASIGLESRQCALPPRLRH
jgi:glycogen synthase